MWNEFQNSLRRLLRNPLSASATVLTIGIGVGATGAIVTVTWSALVQPLPYSAPDRLVHLSEAVEATDERSPTSYPTLIDWRAASDSFSGLEGYDPANFTVGFRDQARVLRGGRVTAGFFGLLGVGVSAGRDFAASVPAAAAEAIVTEDFARSFGSEGPLNQSITINGTSYLVVGVLPRSFHFAPLQDVRVFVPLRIDDHQRADRAQRFLRVVGRLRDGVAIGSAAQQLAAVMADLSDDFPDALAGRTVRAVPLRDALLGNVKPILTSLLVAAALLLAIMASNLALLTLARNVDRTGELEIRTALGATRARLVQQLTTEGMLPGLAGGMLAVFVGHLASRQLLGAIPVEMRTGMPYLEGTGLSSAATATMLAIAIALSLGFGIVAALLSIGTRERSHGGRATRGRRARMLRHALVAAQMATSVVLLVCSALLVASFGNLMTRNLGFSDPASLVTARAPLSGPRYEDASAQRGFYEQLLAGAAALPGVRDAALIDEAPGGGGRLTSFEDMQNPSPPTARPQAALRIIGGDYFRAMGIPVINGRTFDGGDRADARLVAVVSQRFAERLRDGSGSSLGRRFRLASTGALEWEVVGVVGDVQTTAVDSDAPPAVYLSHLQAAENRMTVVLRTDLDAAAVENQLRSLVTRLDSTIPVYAAVALDRRLADSRAVFSRRLPMVLFGGFALSALALTLVALYSTFAYEVSARRRELGIRAALGATPSLIRRQIMRNACGLAGVGIGVGVLGTIVVSGAIQPVLFGIDSRDWRIYLAVAIGALAVAVLSSLGPAMRAGSQGPTTALRQE